MSNCINFRRFSGPDEKDQYQSNRRIERLLKRDKDTYQATYRLLLLGAGESGKSTIVKQMKIIHVEGGYSEEDRRNMVVPIRRNVRDAISALLGAMERIKPPERLENEEEAWRVQYLFEVGTKLDTEYPQEFFDHCRVLWQDSGVQRTFARSNEFHLIDSAKYFLDQVDIIARDDYFPTDQDILRCRILTSGIFETRFQVEKVNFHMFDVGGQRSERRRWIQCFSEVTAIIFVTACSAYDLTLLEDPSKNRLRESLELFESVFNNKWLSRVSIILFLNKEDLLQEKIALGKSKLEDYFPDFADFEVPDADAKEKMRSSHEWELSRAKNFIRSLFLAISTATPQDTHYCYPHFTCAVDTERMRIVFKDCRDIIQRKIISSFVCF